MRKRPLLPKRRATLSPRPTLLFSPYAWAKLVYLRDLGPTEIGGFGVSHPLNPLLVIDVCLIQQLATPVTVTFDDTAVADFFDAQVDRGFTPQQFARIWIYTHPGSSPQPSRTDEETLARVFAECDWSVMFIIARSGDNYARLRFNTGPGGDIRLPVGVDYQTWFWWTPQWLSHDAVTAKFKTWSLS